MISGNNAVGIRFNSGNSSNTVQGNYVGTNATGNGAVPNTWGIYLFQSNGNTFGGTAAGAGNLISGNGLDGPTFLQSNSNVATGNRIGTDVTGLVDLGNGRDGILIEASSSSTL